MMADVFDEKMCEKVGGLQRLDEWDVAHGEESDAGCHCRYERWIGQGLILLKCVYCLQVGYLYIITAYLTSHGFWSNKSRFTSVALGLLLLLPFQGLYQLYRRGCLHSVTKSCTCRREHVVSCRDQEKAMSGGPDPGTRAVNRFRRFSVFMEIGLYMILAFVCYYFTSFLWTFHEYTSGNMLKAPIEVQGIPSYVTKYAPVVWLDEGELYMPSDMFAQINNTKPEVEYLPIPKVPSPLTVHNLDLLNKYGNGGRGVFLTSVMDITEDPDWLSGVIPDTSGKTRNVTSSAIIVNDRGNGTVDAFYMYFYAYNQGPTIFRGGELGNHVGDWEHNMIRFEEGVPQAVWYSQHNGGQAFVYDVVQKIGDRPVSYSALGSHANYAIPGIHDHLIPELNLPNGLLRDYTSEGTLWDPLRSAYHYHYNGTTKAFSSAGEDSPLGVMHYKGRWGDEQYPDDDPRQRAFFGFRKYVGGPTGPYNKQLNRTAICPTTGRPCFLRTQLGP